VGILGIAVALATQGTASWAGERGSPLLSKEFKAAATRALVSLERLHSVVCVRDDNAWQERESQAKDSVGKVKTKGQTKAENSLNAEIERYFVALSIHHSLHQIVHLNHPASPCTDDAGQYEERPRIMKALDLDEPAIARLLLKQQAAPEAILDSEEAVGQFLALVDTSNGMFKRAVAAAKKLETWYEINPDNPDAEALQAEWCGNQKALDQKIRELGNFWGERGTTLEDALHHSGLDVDSILALGDAMKEGTGLLDAPKSERRRLEGMGCNSK
jgi:hypothetical protein